MWGVATGNISIENKNLSIDRGLNFDRYLSHRMNFPTTILMIDSKQNENTYLISVMKYLQKIIILIYYHNYFIQFKINFDCI